MGTGLSAQFRLILDNFGEGGLAIQELFNDILFGYPPFP